MTEIYGTETKHRNEGIVRLVLLGMATIAIFMTLLTASVANAQTRSLKVHFIHTKESAEITYMRNGRYVQQGLDQLNRFLRDWRRNEPTKMDPRLFDMMWEIYRQSGASGHIHIVSAYRSPATNAMLRSRSSGVAEKSQHTLGKAIDFYIPGVQLSRLRAAALRVEGGGVGYYPRSGSPFIHIDVGNVRHWPRMNRNELMALFPNGQTIHVPSDGKPLPGFQQAKAAYDARQRGGTVQVASSSGSSGGGRGLLATLFRGGGADADEDEAESAAPTRPSAPAQARQPVPQQAIASAPAAAPAPAAPDAIIAALPERSIPVPRLAPRPSAEVGAAPAPVAAPVPEAPQAVATALVEENAAQVAANVPIPSRRPDYTPPAQQVASAEQLPVSAMSGRSDAAGGSEAISELLAMSAAEARSDVVINNVPVPQGRPDRETPVQTASVETAAIGRGTADDAGAGEVFALAALPKVQAMESTAAIMPTRPDGLRAAPIEPEAPGHREAVARAASPRVAMLSREGNDWSSALDSGVRTTAKSAKPRAGEGRRDRRPVTLPVAQARTDWALRRDLTEMNVEGAAARAAAHDAVRTAPKAVYTTGFQRNAGAPDPHRFTGSAVTFLSIARFGN